jgi:myo-inositol-1(or 4)-monophosphatase
MVDPVLNPWDLLPVIPVIRGAGGVITDWDGGPAEKGCDAVAASQGVHGSVIRMLGETRPGRP